MPTQGPEKEFEDFAEAPFLLLDNSKKSTAKALQLINRWKDSGPVMQSES